MVYALSAALIGAFLAARLGQSVIVGYILAGIAIGPFTPGLVGDLAVVQALADIGVIFLLFTIGVQLSLRDLLRVGRIAVVGGTVEVLLMLGLGSLIGRALGWPPLQAFIFGAVLSNSSSTVLTKVLGERGELGTIHGRISLGWSSIQDLGTVILIVIITALATDAGSLGTGLLWAIAKAALFLALLIILGSLGAPWLFERVAALRNREVFVLTVAVVALGTAYAASFFGLSLALGAFVAGVMVGESDLSQQILRQIMPFRDVFAGLFFVSVGILINPGFVAGNLPLVLLTVALIVVAKGAICAGITLLSGYSLRTGLLTGITLAQSAEFSFLLATVGLGLGAISLPVYSLMLAGAGVSIIISPTLHRLGGSLANRLERRRNSQGGD